MRDLTQIEISQASGGFIFAPFIWGTIIGAVTYAFKNKDHPFEPEAFAVATIGGGVTGSFGALGAAGKVIGLANTINTIEAVEHLENRG
tara:strand:+ start:125958 stop:126224 length:267 start_codon:yes stop_codon:yes gene_type:complete